MYSDSTKCDNTTIVATVYNIGMKTSLFKVKLTKCPLQIATNCTQIQSLEAQIFPFHRHNYILNLYGALIKSNINCTRNVNINLPTRKNIIIYL